MAREASLIRVTVARRRGCVGFLPDAHDARSHGEGCTDPNEPNQLSQEDGSFQL